MSYIYVFSIVFMFNLKKTYWCNTKVCRLQQRRCSLAIVAGLPLRAFWRFGWEPNPLTMMLFCFCLKPPIRETHTKSEKHQKKQQCTNFHSYPDCNFTWWEIWCWQSSTLWPLAVLFLPGDSEKNSPLVRTYCEMSFLESTGVYVMTQWYLYCILYHFFHLLSF